MGAPRVEGQPVGVDDGFSIIEVMVAVTVLLIVLGGTVSAMVGSIESVRGSRHRQQAVAMANEAIERARSLPIDDLAMLSGDPWVPASATFDHDGSGSMSAETVLVTSTGQVTGPSYHRNEDGFFVYTLVTWFADPLRTNSEDTRRVTAMVLWTASDGSPEMVRLSTLVADLERGVG